MTRSKKQAPASATITVEWCDETHSITLTPRNWAAIKAGKPHTQRGDRYEYEGESFWSYWRFGGGLDGPLIVGYGDGGEGFVGQLSDAGIEECVCKPKRRRRSTR